MKQYIDKASLVEALHKNIKSITRLLDLSKENELDIHLLTKVHAYEDMLDFVNALEVKEVDLKDERMKDCPYRLVGCARYSHTITECNGACAWVVDYPKLKELKAKKGE